MKKYIFIALAAIAALSSCSKESLVSNEENGKEAQVFTATMEDGITTKVMFDGTNKCALWEIDDAISIDGHQYTATSAGASSTFTGSGATETPHHAYFPANLYNDGTPTLPAEQTYAEGKFNMPMYAESSSLELSFKNLCAVLAITVNKSNLVSTTTTSLKSIKVSSDKRMHGAFTATSEGVLSFKSQADPADAEKSVTLKIDGGVDISTDKTFYIAIPAQEYSYLKIYLSADGILYKEAMITQKATGLGKIARSTMFNIPYKTNAVQIYANGPYWSTMNIGATTETGFGQYFGWGEKTGHALTTDAQSTLASYSYEVNIITNAFEGSHSFSSPNPTIDGDNQDPEILPASNDAATVNWGEGWRMPTGNEGEFKALKDNTSSEWIDNSTGIKGRRFTGNNSYSDITLFFPAAGVCDGTDLYDAGSYGDYLSSSLATGGTDNAYDMYFDSGGVNPQNNSCRFWGYSVRPVSTEGVAPAPTPTTTGTAKRTGDIDVNWVQLWENGPKFAEYNVGVTDGKAESYGGYYAWGGSQDKVDDHNTGTVDLSPTSDPITDTATKLWGSNWRMPTQTELEELLSNCTVENVVDPSDDTKLLGTKFTGKGAYASNSVFLPAAGGCNVGTVTGQGAGSLFWSSSPEESDSAYGLFSFGSPSVTNIFRNTGGSVRAVLK